MSLKLYCRKKCSTLRRIGEIPKLTKLSVFEAKHRELIDALRANELDATSTSKCNFQIWCQLYGMYWEACRVRVKQ